MLTSLKFTGTQVLVLCILIGAGFLASKLRWLTEDGVKSITNLILYLVTPCMMIRAFQRPFDAGLLRGFLIAAAATVVIYVAEILLGKLLFRREEDARRRVLEFGTIFTNCGFMAFPLLEAIRGSEAVVYGAAFNSVHVIFLWTYGLALMANGKEKINLRKAVLNPGTVSAVIGLIIFFCSIKLPTLIAQPIEHLANLNAPVPMILIGYYLANMDFRGVMRTKGEIIMLAMRLVIVPLATLGALYLCGVRGTLLISVVVCISAPAATMATMFSTKYDGDPTFASGVVTVSTLLSIVTMTLIVGFACFIAG